MGIPKKTLEDYTQIFKKVKLLTNINEFSNRKMGFLRTYLRKNQSKLRKALKAEKLRLSEEKQRGIASAISSIDTEAKESTECNSEKSEFRFCCGTSEQYPFYEEEDQEFSRNPWEFHKTEEYSEDEC